MKTPRFLPLLLIALFAFLTPRQAEARVETSFDFFYDSLSPYGEWVQVADYGVCWRPNDVDRDWAPYTDGYWAFTDAGWTWVSYEDYGGIVYHYGRWVRVEDEGWCWVPDYEWGPAWVSWRNNDDYVGWAPLPPEARWQPEVGIGIWVDRDCDIGPAYFNFCRVRDFGAPVLRPVIINRIENVTIIRRTVNITNITYNTHYGNGAVIFNGGPNFVFINERSARRVPALKLVQNANIDLTVLRGDRRRNFNGLAVGNQLVVTAPFVKPPADPGFLKPKVTKVFAADKVKRGWNGNEEVRQELKQEMQRQTQGLTRETAPARPVVVTDLKVLPEKADPQAASPVATRERGERPDRKDRTPAVTGQASGPDSGDAPRSKPTAEAVTPPSPDRSQKAAQAEQEKAARRQADAAAQQQERQQQQAEAQRQAEVARQQQKEEAAAARQKMQEEQGRAARQQAAAAAAQQRQAEAAAAQQRQAEAAAAAQQKQQETLRRQQGDQQAAQQLQRQQAAEQQRAQREANEQARRAAQESQRQQNEAQREAQRPPRVAPPAVAPAPTATPSDSDGGRRKKKDKDKDN